MNHRILAIIPARGGSKGLPRKNLYPLHGKPLIAWTIEQALGSRHLDRVLVSTDDREIAGVARDLGAAVPFLRPLELAGDRSPVSEAVFHALDWLGARGEHYDILALLEPTSPLRKPSDIDSAIEYFLGNLGRADSLVSLGEIHLENPSITKVIRDGYVVPFIEKGTVPPTRQELAKVYFPYGVIYLSTVDAYRKYRTFYQDRTLAYPIERWQNYEVDDFLDIVCIRAVMEEKMKEMAG
ncbi:MAG: acylneuraminate cytidylyltransferase family protein [Methanomicrobiales archaeon]|nr:acylneuraminate cytidylyltransferase family protein [Methanomicrobiales archaeon]